MESLNITDRSNLYGESGKYSNCNFFIEAGAGAGKTETIINMIVAQLFNGVSPEKIVAITFTNKATEELLNRISSELIKRIEKGDLNDNQLQILKNAKDNLYKMNVSTIHHFCNVVLNENSYKAKLSFNVTLLEEDDEQERRNRFYSKWFHSLGKDQIEEISETDSGAFWKLKDTFGKLCNQFDDIETDSEIFFDEENLYEKLKELYEELKFHMANAYISVAAGNFMNAFSGIFESGTVEESKQAFQNSISDIIGTVNKKISLNKTPKMYYAANEVEQINNGSIKPMVNECVDIKVPATAYYKVKCYSTLNKYAIDAWCAYKKSRDRASLSNDQLIYETYQMINEDPSVKEKLAKKYDVIFVDEFQDTDKYQNKFIMDLALAIDERKQKDNIMSTSLVLVGDPKQSIYAFRGADFELFTETQNGFSTCGLRNAINVFLPDNYRSNQYILNWINDTYRDRSFYDGYKYADMILPDANCLPNDEVSNLLAGVYTYGFNATGNKFDALANFIKKLKEEEYLIYSREGKNSSLQPRPVDYRDILVLTTSHSETNNYVMAFNKANIKTLVAGEFDLCSSIAFNSVYRILMCVLNREVNNRKLFESSFNAVMNDRIGLDRIIESTKDLSPYGKMIYVFNHIDLIFEDFDQSDKDLLRTILTQVIENLCYDNSASTVEIIDQVEKLIHKPADAELSLEYHEDAVRIMNVHKAKGLTAEIVIIADSGGFHAGSGCKTYQNKIYLNSMGFNPEVEVKYDADQEAEKLRLEYVASTRARQVMIFESDIKSPTQMFNRTDHKYDLSDLDKYHVDTALPEITIDESQDETKSVEIKAAGFSPIDESLLSVKCVETSPSLLEKSSSIKPVEAFEKYKRPANNIYGTVFHRVMELYVLNPYQDMEMLVDRAVNENITDIPAGEVDRYRKYLTECAFSVDKLFREEKILESFPVRKPELKFCDFDETLYGEKPTLMSGSIDLMLKNDDRILIIDYKTDTNHYRDNDEFELVLKDRYQCQLETYKKIVGKMEEISSDRIETKIVWMEEKGDETIAHFAGI